MRRTRRWPKRLGGGAAGLRLGLLLLLIGEAGRRQRPCRAMALTAICTLGIACSPSLLQPLQPRPSHCKWSLSVENKWFHSNWCPFYTQACRLSNLSDAAQPQAALYALAYRLAHELRQRSTPWPPCGQHGQYPSDCHTRQRCAPPWPPSGHPEPRPALPTPPPQAWKCRTVRRAAQVCRTGETQAGPRVYLTRLWWGSG